MDIKECVSRIRNTVEGISHLEEIDIIFSNGWPELKLYGKNIPIFPWRHNPKFNGMKSCIDDGTVKTICSMKSLYIAEREANISFLISRELDICEWLTGGNISEIYAVINNRTANIIAIMDSEVVCTVEIAATLNKSTRPIERHEIFAREGIVRDSSIDSVIPQQALYCFNIDEEKPETYTDFDAGPYYGLNHNETELVFSVLETLANENKKNYFDRKKHLMQLASYALRSVESNKKIKILGEEK